VEEARAGKSGARHRSFAGKSDSQRRRGIVILGAIEMGVARQAITLREGRRSFKRG